MEALVCLAFPLSLNVHDHRQCFTMYYHIDPIDDPHHLMDPILENRLAGQQEKPFCESTLYEISLAETDCFCKDTLMLINK